VHGKVYLLPGMSKKEIMAVYHLLKQTLPKRRLYSTFVDKNGVEHLYSRSGKRVAYVNKKGKVSEHSTDTASAHSSGERSEDVILGDLLQQHREQKSAPVRVKIERPFEEKIPQQREVLPHEMSFFEYQSEVPEASETPETVRKRIDSLGLSMTPSQIQQITDKLLLETPKSATVSNELKEFVERHNNLGHGFTNLRNIAEKQSKSMQRGGQGIIQHINSSLGTSSSSSSS